MVCQSDTNGSVQVDGSRNLKLSKVGSRRFTFNKIIKHRIGGGGVSSIRRKNTAGEVDRSIVVKGNAVKRGGSRRGRKESPRIVEPGRSAAVIERSRILDLERRPRVVGDDRSIH